MNFEIRKLEHNDLPIVQEIAKEVIREKYKVFFTQDAIDWFINSGESDKEFVNNFENCNVLVSEGKITGFNIFSDNFIHLMMVELNLQRNGYGKILLDYAEKSIAEKDYKTLKLETFKENVQAIKFYEKNGWEIVSEKEEDGLGVTRVFLEKEI